MSPYTGIWSKELAAHLLRRTTLGPTQAQIDLVLSEGVDLSVENILQEFISLDEPITWHPGETVALQGETWVDQYMTADPLLEDQTNGARQRSLYSWASQRMNKEQLLAPNITEKMIFFWQNHFGVEQVQDDRLNYDYFKTLEANAIGNFKTIVENITVDGAMMQFLDTASNTKWNPNENFSRELLELFSIGKGLQTATGDYSNYTEDDILAGARILTGWKVRESMSSTANPYIEFDASHHDTDAKELSYHFNYMTLYNDDENEYKNFIDAIFQKQETAYHICRKLYRYFVSTEVTEQIENTVIETMAQTLIANNYEVRPVLVELFKSEHFYDATIIGSHLKTPFEFIYSILNPTLSMPDYNYEGNNVIWGILYGVANSMDQNPFVPPSVAGWPAYYVKPGYMQLWLNSATIDRRFWLVNMLTEHSVGISSDITGTVYSFKIDALAFVNQLHITGTVYSFKIDALAFVNQLQNPSDGVAVIDQMCELFFSKPLLQTKKDRLLNVLANFLPAFEWTLQYGEYIANPHDPVLSEPVKQRVEAVLSEIFKLPEFQSC
jgi:uncharacterized protein (DUF1800 family)